MSHKTILPYVGGKQAVVRRLAGYFPVGLQALGSPFIGGGSVEVYFAARGVKVTAADACWELATFWQVLLSDPKALADRFRSKVPIQYPLDPYRDALRAVTDDPVETACLLYILIMCGFSHIIARESGGSPRNTYKINTHRGAKFSKISDFKAPNLSVECMDCFDFLGKYPCLPLYCDPPYANGSQDLYGFSEDLHSGFPHERWAKALLSHNAPWVQSYGDCELVRDVYAGCVIDTEQWKYGSTNAGGGGKGVKDGFELVIRPPGSPPLETLLAERRSVRKQAVLERQRARAATERLLYD